MRGNQGDVVFDYEGALSLARHLSSLADEVAHVAKVRQSLADDAKRGFTGLCAYQFSTRMSQEEANCTRASQGLRDDAMALALMWKGAMEEENRRLYARHVDDMKEQRNILQDFSDFFTGFHYPPEPAPVPLPLPPAFVPTAEHVRY